MKIKDLIEQLQKLDPELLVVLSKDEEGNGYSELAYIEPNSRFSEGEVSPNILTEELDEEGWSEEDFLDDGIPCVILWP